MHHRNPNAGAFSMFQKIKNKLFPKPHEKSIIQKPEKPRQVDCYQFDLENMRAQID